MITNREKSCGAVVYANSAEGIRYILMHSHKGHWGLPKGHEEPGEGERDTAAREIWEETGLRVRFIDGFRETDTHALVREGRPDTVKDIVYFLAVCDDPRPCPQDTGEVAGVALMDYESALAAVRTDDASRRILESARRFLEAERRPFAKTSLA